MRPKNSYQLLFFIPAFVSLPWGEWNRAQPLVLLLEVGPGTQNSPSPQFECMVKWNTCKEWWIKAMNKYFTFNLLIVGTKQCNVVSWIFLKKNQNKTYFSKKSLWMDEFVVDLGMPWVCLHKANGNPALKYVCGILILWEDSHCYLKLQYLVNAPEFHILRKLIA